MSKLSTFAEVQKNLDVTANQLTYVIQRDGIVALKRGGRGRGGGRLFSSHQIKCIQTGLENTRTYSLND